MVLLDSQPDFLPELSIPSRIIGAGLLGGTSSDSGSSQFHQGLSRKASL